MFRKGLELDWLCPSVLLYLVAVCPPIWILELKMADIRWAVHCCSTINLEQWWCVNIKLDISTRRERLCLYYQLIVGEVDGCDEKATPTPRVYLLLELMQVSCLVILFHSLFQWTFFTQAPEKFSLLLSREVLILTFQKSFHSLPYVFRRHAPICPSLKVFVGGTTQTLQGTKTLSTRSRIPGVCTLIAYFHLN